VIGAIGGIAFSVGARLTLGLVSLGVVFVMLAYGRIKAHWGVLGNVIVAVLGSMPFLYGAWAAGAPIPGLLLVGIAAPLHFAREIAKDIDDIDGDRGHRKTLPIVAGVPVARLVSVIATMAFIIAWVALMGERWMTWPAVALAIAGAYWGMPAIY